jgi:D-proline reductase (dithiol) PrdB
MRFARVDLADIDQLYIRMHERWWQSHGPVMTYVKNASLAFTRPAKAVTEACVALITTGGIHLKDQLPFDMENRLGDATYRLIPGDTPLGDLRFTHDHYDHTSADRDPNCMFPLEPLRELAREGRIKAAAPTHVGFSGWIPKTEPLVKESVPRVIERLKQDGVDVALLTGG